MQQAYAIPELESYISTLRAEDIDKQYVFYNFLIDAYVNNKRVDAELARRTPVIQSGAAGRKDVTLWLGLAAKQPADRAAELLTAADKGGVSIETLGAFGRVLLARLYARAGRTEAALDAYTSVATSILAGAAGTIQPNTLYTDAYGRDNGLMLFTGLGLFEDARQHLDAPMTGQLVAAMLALARPPASPTVEQAYARFVHVLYMRTLQANMTVPALRQAASELKPSTMWPRSEVLLAAFVRAHLGRIDEAAALVQSTLRRDLDTREPITAIVSNAMYASRQYQIALGLVGDLQLLGPFGTTGTGVEEFKPLFANKADAWPGASAWTSRIARDLPVWIERREINRDAGVQLLSLMAIRLKQIGDTAGAEAASKALSSALGGLVLLKSATLAVAATDKIGAPVDLAVAQSLVRANRLHTSRVVSTIARTEKEQGAPPALALGAAAAEFTSNAELLKQIIGIAQASRATDDLKRWTDRQTEVAAARQRLSAKPAPPSGK